MVVNINIHALLLEKQLAKNLGYKKQPTKFGMFFEHYFEPCLDTQYIDFMYLNNYSFKDYLVGFSNFSLHLKMKKNSSYFLAHSPPPGTMGQLTVYAIPKHIQRNQSRWPLA